MGEYYSENSRLKNYETCVAMLCLMEANKEGRYDKAIANDKYVKGLQLDEGENRKASDFTYGGVGYGPNGRPDLSNTAFLMNALVAAGNGPDDEAVKKAMIFVSRCRESGERVQHHAICGQGQRWRLLLRSYGARRRPKGQLAGGWPSQLRIDGAYAGLKSMLYAGLKRDDSASKRPPPGFANTTT